MGDDTRYLLVQAIYPFQGKNNDENVEVVLTPVKPTTQKALWFKKGDVIKVTQKEDGGWWEGTLGEKTGWFPSNYVKEYHVQGDSVSSSSSRNAALTLSPAQQKAYRDVVVRDIIDSEQAHVAELQTLSTNFLQPLEKAQILTRDEYHQLVSNMAEVVSCHQALLAALEECAALPTNEQRVGHIFLTSAPRLQQVHQTYCAAHPRAVCVLDKYRDELNSWMEAAGATVPGILVLTTGLSKPFRRLEKYAGMLQELERHIEEHDPDRGDTQRSVSVFKDISSACSAVRRQKELELEVVTGGVRGWEGEDLRTLGDIVHMGSVAVGPDHRDRYFVLFPNTLLMLSVSHRMSAFIYEGKLPLTGITINKLENTDNCKNAFEIVGPMIERILAICQTREDQQRWVDVIRQQIRAMHNAMHISPRSPRVETPPQLIANAVAHANQNTSLVRNNVLNNNPTSPVTNAATGPVNINLINKQKIINNTLQNINNNNNNNVKPWSVTKLRPSAPLRPGSALSRDENVRRSGRGARKPNERGTSNYEEDALVLKVIEAYCTSDKMRYTVSSAVLDHPSSVKSDECLSPFNEKSINTAIITLKEQVQDLQNQVSNVSSQLDRETQARRNLQNLIHSHVTKNVPLCEE